MNHIINDKPLSSSAAETLERVYLSSFPDGERRDWCDLRSKADDRSHPLSLYTITDDSGVPVGLITVWNFSEFFYVEHFAVDSAARGGGLGGRALDETLAMLGNGKPVVLEVEPPTGGYGPVAERRVGFYRRHGFTDFPHYNYIQPPYSPGLPSLPLMLMSTCAGVDLDMVSATLHREVYGVDK